MANKRPVCDANVSSVKLINDQCWKESQTVQLHSFVHRGNSFEMKGFILVLLSLSHTKASPTRPREEVKCGIVETIVPQEKCHHEEVCHEEFEVVVTTTVIEECEDIVTTHCHKEHTDVLKTSNIVGHDTRLVGHEVGPSYHRKREATAGHDHHYSQPVCEDKVERKCHKKPIEDSHKIPHTKCHTVPHCHPVEIVVPREVCVHLHFKG